MSMKTFSKAKVTMDGKVILARDSMAFDPGGVERAVQKSMAGIDGFSETTKEASLELDFSLLKGMSIDDFRNADDVTLVIELDTDQTYVMRNAWCVNPPPISAGSSAGVKVTFNSKPAEEIL